MSADIVTRLRANNNEHDGNERHCLSCNDFCCHCELCDCCLKIFSLIDEAVAEIERLRAEISKMKPLFMISTRDLSDEEYLALIQRAQDETDEANQ